MWARTLPEFPGRFARSRERDARHGRPPTRRPGSAGCRAAALVGLRDLQEVVVDAPDEAIDGKRSPMEIPAVLSFAVLLWLG
jgi:hypothetical protein